VRRLLAALLVFASAPAAAQTAAPPGPWVIDLRGTTSGLPKDTAFFPGIPAETIVPARGFGFDVGAHVYVLTFGPSRLGVGANYMRARGTTEGIAANLSTLAPQVSVNFGTSAGWSYLSAGYGRAWVRTTVERDAGTATAAPEPFGAVNFGGGARWFLSAHVGVGFDLRFHQLSGPPRTTLMAAAIGFSIR
jgi:hypothetical protein